MQLRTILATTVAALAAWGADTGSTSPVKELTATEISNLSGATTTQLTGLTFKTAAWADVTALGNGSGNNTERQTGSISAVYRGVAEPNTGGSPVPAETAAPPSGSVFNFKQTGDSAQAWATMRSNGMPFLFAQAFGQSSAEANASWSTRISFNSIRSLTVAFKLPAITVGGALEGEGPSRWQSRLRADLLIDGTVVWSTEASRFNVPNGTTGSGNNCSERSDDGLFLNNFGKSLGLGTNANTPAPGQTVYLKLGTFSAGKQIEVSLVVRADAVSRDKCCLKNGELFCSRANARVEWDNSSSPVKFWTTSVWTTIPPLLLN